MLVALVTGRAEVTDPLAYALLGARVVQSSVHLISIAPRAVHVRFTAFMTQVAIATYWAVRLLTS